MKTARKNGKKIFGYFIIILQIFIIIMHFTPDFFTYISDMFYYGDECINLILNTHDHPSDVMVIFPFILHVLGIVSLVSIVMELLVYLKNKYVGYLQNIVSSTMIAYDGIMIVMIFLMSRFDFHGLLTSYLWSNKKIMLIFLIISIVIFCISRIMLGLQKKRNSHCAKRTDINYPRPRRDGV